MMAELAAEQPGLVGDLCGVNAFGSESGNEAMTDGRTIPLLQDDATANVWGLWGVTYRDVHVLDGQNRLHAVYNLTSNDLAVPANYEALRALVLEAAQAP